MAAVSIALVVIAMIALAPIAHASWPAPGVQMGPGTYDLTVTSGPASMGGAIDIYANQQGTVAGFWAGADGMRGDVWFDSTQTRYELPNGDYIYFYGSDPDQGQFIRTNSSGVILATGNWQRR